MPRSVMEFPSVNAAFAGRIADSAGATNVKYLTADPTS